MPGVPSGKACEGCRQQKKKCDEKTPCSRCLRLQIECVGSGQQRFKFKHSFPIQIQIQQKTQTPPKKKPNANANANIKKKVEKYDKVLVLAPPTNPTTTLSTIFIAAIKPTTTLKYNLLWAYGGYLADIPRRLGINDALDSSVAALTTAHSSYCTQRTISVDALKKYSRALQILRVYLDDPVKAASPETLCAVSLLLTCQAFVGNQGARWTGHAEGAAQILKARGGMAPRDDFERKLLLSLRGPVLVEGLFNDRISLSAQEWADLVGNDLDGSTPEGEMMCCLSKVPDIMRRAKCPSTDMTALQAETHTLYSRMKDLATALGKKYTDLGHETTDLLSIYKHAHAQRVYGLTLTITLIFNCLLGAFHSEEILQLESAYFANEIIILAEQAGRYRPLGGGYIMLGLMTAWAVTDDLILRTVIREYMNDYQTDYPHQTTTNMEEQLVCMSNAMRLLQVE